METVLRTGLLGKAGKTPLLDLAGSLEAGLFAAPVEFSDNVDKVWPGARPDGGLLSPTAAAAAW